MDFNVSYSCCIFFTGCDINVTEELDLVFTSKGSEKRVHFTPTARHINDRMNEVQPKNRKQIDRGFEHSNMNIVININLSVNKKAEFSTNLKESVFFLLLLL